MANSPPAPAPTLEEMKAFFKDDPSLARFELFSEP